MDEISPDGPTDVWEVKPGSVRTWVLEPSQYGLESGASEGLAGGTPAENAEMVLAILAEKDTGVRRTAVLLNAAAALVVAGVAKDWKDAVGKARESIASGAGDEGAGESCAGV